MGGIRSYECMCECQSENPFVCFGAKPTQKYCARDLPRDGRTREGRSLISVNRKEHKTTVVRKGHSKKGHSQEKGAAKTSRQSRSV